jgi:hypothetical protein
MPSLSETIADIRRRQIVPVKSYSQLRPWTPKLSAGAHIDATENTEVTPENYKRWAYNQIEEMNKTYEPQFGRRLSSDTVDYVVDRYRMLAGGESQFAIDHFARAQEKLAENPLVAFKAGAAGTMSNFGASLMGVFSPETAASMRRNAYATYGPSPGVAGFAGNLVGTAATLIPALYSGGIASASQIGMQGFGGSRLQTYDQRQIGAEISLGQEFGAAIATGLVEAASGYLSFRLTKAVGLAAQGIGPGAQAAARNGGEKGLTLFLQRALKMIPGMAAEAGEEGMTQIINNAIAKGFSIDEDIEFTEGVAEAALTGALLSPLLGPVASYKHTQRLKAMEKGQVTPPGQTPQEGQLPVQVPQHMIKAEDQPNVTVWEDGEDVTFTQPSGSAAQSVDPAWDHTKQARPKHPEAGRPAIRSKGGTVYRSPSDTAETPLDVMRERGFDEKKIAEVEALGWEQGHMNDDGAFVAGPYKPTSSLPGTGLGGWEAVVETPAERPRRFHRDTPTDQEFLDQLADQTKPQSLQDRLDDIEYDAVEEDDRVNAQMRAFALEDQVADLQRAGLIEPTKLSNDRLVLTELGRKVQRSQHTADIYQEAKTGEPISLIGKRFKRPADAPDKGVGGWYGLAPSIRDASSGPVEIRDITLRNPLAVDTPMEALVALHGQEEAEAIVTRSGLEMAVFMQKMSQGQEGQTETDEAMMESNVQQATDQVDRILARAAFDAGYDGIVLRKSKQLIALKSDVFGDQEAGLGTHKGSPNGYFLVDSSGAGNVPTWSGKGGRNDGLPPQDPIEPMPGGHERDGINLGIGVEDTVSPISYLLNRINPKLGGLMQKFEAATKFRVADELRIFGRFGKGKRLAFKAAAKRNAKGKSRRKYRQELHMNFDNAVGNGDFDRAARILKDVAVTPEEAEGLIARMHECREMFARLRENALNAGIDVGQIEMYWPRNVKDHKKYMADLHPGEDAENLIQEKIQEVESRKQRALTKQEKNDIANKVIQGFGPQLPGRGVGTRNFKQRKVAQVPMEHQYLYASSDYAAVNYINRTVEATEAAKFFGRPGAPRAIPGEGDGVDIPMVGETVDMEDSIGAHVMRLVEEKQITPQQQTRVRELIMSRFRGGMQSPTIFWRTFRDIGYAVTIGNPLSALVQFGDVALSAVENGLWYTSKGIRISAPTAIGLGKAAQTTTEDGRVLFTGDWKLDMIGLHEVSADFGSVQKTAAFVEFMMKWSGFKLVDGFGKLVHVNASWLRFQDIVKDMSSDQYKAFEKEWKPILGADYAQTVQDIRAGAKTENVAMMMFCQVMKIQPTALSEMPKRYLDMTNGRVMYMLKTFTVKQTNYLRQKSLDKIYRGSVITKDADEVKEGFKELLRFVMLFGMAGAGVDLLKDFLVGKPIDMDAISDNTVEGLLKTFGSSKFLVNQVQQKGPAAAFWGYIMPPFGWVTDPIKDAQKIPEFCNGEADFDDVKTMRDLPLVGKFIYQRWGGGAEYSARERRSRRTKKRTAAREEAMKAYADGDKASAGAIIAHYNATRPEGMKPITSKGLKQAIKNRARKEAEE